ncbi:MAG: M1 family metallopeptidase, partial [Actinomycetes bacterium]
LNDKLHGFYRSTYRDEAGEETVLATTQFEPADARRAFPCWDEPDLKATFAVSLVIDDGLTAISNGRVVGEEPGGDGRKRVTFAETMVMSTYLVAFVVGPFDFTAPVDVQGVPMRIATPPGRTHMTSFALEAGSFALDFLTRYFELPYPADKLDHVAIPDFAFGAMENLGCVTYRETALLLEGEHASQLERQRVAQVISHETAHMWFGDLVTMKWWNGIWLNEAFATFMELTTTDAMRPDWDVWSGFSAGKAAALLVDGLRATRPVEFEVGPPDEAEAMFDVLTYQKGGSVLKMLEQYLGPAAFRKGITYYLSEHRHGNTETADLWNAIEAASGEPVRTIMDSWILQGGYPLITVEPGPDSNSVSLAQRRFLYAGEADGTRWSVPINLRASVAGSVQHQKLLLDQDRTTVAFDGPIDWLVVNDGAWGFYRVRYAPELLNRLSGRLQELLSPLERQGVLIDTWAGVEAGWASLSQWATLVAGLGSEDDPDVWAAALSPLGLLDLIADEATRPALQAFVRRAVGPMAARLG